MWFTDVSNEISVKCQTSLSLSFDDDVLPPFLCRKPPLNATSNPTPPFVHRYVAEDGGLSSLSSCSQHCASSLPLSSSSIPLCLLVFLLLFFFYLSSWKFLCLSPFGGPECFLSFPLSPFLPFFFFFWQLTCFYFSLFCTFFAIFYLCVM
jgi:hypothetical protein